MIFQLTYGCCTDNIMAHPSLERPAKRSLSEPRAQTVRTYSMTEADLHEKFAAVSLQARQQCEALFKTAHGDLGAAWMASRTAVSSLAMLQVCKNAM